MYSELTEKFIKTERVFSGSVLKLNVDTIELPNGNQATREWVEHPGAVAVVPLCRCWKRS